VCLSPTRPLPDFSGVATPEKSVLCRTQRHGMHKTSLFENARWRRSDARFLRSALARQPTFSNRL
ncbi:hypothetical protein, partial [Gluconacetobacter johannae]|uniref:hypothetical protein n=1 Tax=Gluconacetobacter johannae TaxID=112140 RepID=UPI001C803018